MPTYEYVCSSCRHAWEEVQKISEPPLRTCPKCSKATAQRQISGGNFILKGGGWYSDLYSSPKPGAAGKKDDAGSESKSSKDDSGSSAKSEAKKESSPPPAKTESNAPKASGSS